MAGSCGVFNFIGNFLSQDTCSVDRVFMFAYHREYRNRKSYEERRIQERTEDDVWQKKTQRVRRPGESKRTAASEEKAGKTPPHTVVSGSCFYGDTDIFSGK